MATHLRTTRAAAPWGAVWSAVLLLAGSAPASGQATDLDVTYIERLPRYDYDAAKNQPAAGDAVTFRGHVENWGTTSFDAVPYRWQLDGVTVTSGTAAIAAGQEALLQLPWTWQSGVHRVKLTVDADDTIDEVSETNNEIEDRTNAIIAGFWVEQSAYAYFHQYQKDLGVGSNSWEDWIQRQMRRQNQASADAIWPISPQGVLDRVRIDKVVVVADGALPLNGGVPTNQPDRFDKTVDLMWGFPASQVQAPSTMYADHTTVSENNMFYIERSLIHELGHARYLIDSYGFDVSNNASKGGYDAVQILEGATPVAGSPLMPFLAFDEVLYYNHSGGIMTGPYEFQWSPYEAGALNLIAGQRASCGNYNAPCNIGVYLQNLPESNHVRFVDNASFPLVNANVRIYRATPASGIWYGKTFDNVYDAEYTTDSNGYVHLPRNPFTGGDPIQHGYGYANGVLIFRIQHFGKVWYRFFEVSDLNLQYWQGNTQDAYYTIVLDGANVGVADAGAGHGFHLGQNYPNPVHGSTTIPFALEQEGMVDIALFDVAGRHAATIAHRRWNAGAHEVVWQPERLGAGVYVVRLEAGGRRAQRRLLIH